MPDGGKSDPATTDTKSEIWALLRKAEREGFRVDWTVRHYKVTTPQGETFGVSRSPSDATAWRKIVRDFRQAGLPV